MTPKQIQDALKKRRITQKQIAQKRGVSEMTVSKVINKNTIADPTMTAVAEALGLPKEQVFPEYYRGPKLRRTSKAIGKRPQTNNR